jgi:hypothetical protein
VLLPLFGHLESSEAQNDRFLLYDQLPEDLLAAPLTDIQRAVVFRVIARWSFVGNIVEAGLVEFRLVAPIYGRSVERAWRRTKDFIQTERSTFGNPFAAGFERFAERCIEHNRLHGLPEAIPFRRRPARGPDVAADTEQ